MHDELWDVDDVARYLGFSRYSVYNFVSQRRIPHLKIGGRVRFTRQQIEEWALQHERGVHPQRNQKGVAVSRGK